MTTPEEPWYDAAFGPLYLELYGHRDAAEVHALLGVMNTLHPLPGPFLDIACGWGRLTRELSQGALAVGIDRSRALLDRARGHAAGAHFAEGDMRVLPFAPGAFGSALSLFTSFGYFETAEEDQQVLQEARRVLREDGWFVLDFLNAEVVASKLVPRSARELRGRLVEERRWIDPSGPYLRKEVTISGETPFRFEERVRLYSEAALAGMLERNGLRPIERYGTYDGSAFVPHESPRLIFVCRTRETE